MIHHCSYCNYKSNHKWVVTRHVNNVHKNEGRAPTSTLQPNIGNYSAKERNYQYESNNQVTNIPSKSNTTQQYNPQIQYNEVRQHGAPTSRQYTVTQNPKTNYGANDEMDTDDESEVHDESEVDHETDNESETDEVDIYEILSDISLSFNRLKELKEQYLKALPQLRELEGDEMNTFSCKYAELKVDVIDEIEGLENVKIQFGKGVDGESEDDESEDGEEFAEEDDEVEEEDDSEGDTDEEAVDEDNEGGDTNEEAVDEDNADEKVKKGAECKGCRKKEFFDFIFDAEKFMDSDFKEKVLEWEKVFRKDITDAIDKDEFNNPEDKDEIIEDVQHLCNEFDENGSLCFKYCSKRKINSISTIADILLTNEVGKNLKQSNPSKYRYIKEMLKPYANSIRELPNTKVSIEKKRKTLQNPNIGEGLLETAESVVIPLLKKSKRT